MQDACRPAGPARRLRLTQPVFSLMFKLLRYFSLTSFISVVVVAAILGFMYRELAIHSLVTMGESNNRAITQVLANSLSPKLVPYLATADTLPSERLRKLLEMLSREGRFAAA